MDFYDSRYFRVNKTLCQCLGVWPFDSNRKYFVRILPMGAVFAFMVPHFIGITVNYDDIDRFMEHICLLLFLLIVFLKFLSVIVAQNEMKLMFNDIMDNWEYILEAEKKEILKSYSERGRIMTFAYMLYILLVGILFTLTPLIPIIRNMLYPKLEPYPRLFLVNAEFLVNRHEHYWKIYCWDLATTIIQAVIVVGADTTFAACVEHCVGLFAIIRKRLKSITESNIQKPTKSAGCDAAYDRMVDIVKLHQRVIRFTDTLENAYSRCFFVIMTSNMILMPLICVMIIMNANQKIQLIRYLMIYSGLTVHLFYLSLAGQKIVDNSSELFYDAYDNEWYKTSLKSKTLLRFFMIRCTSPCTLTAGKLMNMGMETFYAVMKTAISYIAVLASFRSGTSQ